MKLSMDWVVTLTEAGFWRLLVWSLQNAVLITCVWVGLKISRVKSPALRHQVWLFGLVAVTVLPIWGDIVHALPLPGPTSEALVKVAEFPGTIAGAGLQQLGQVASPSPGSLSARKSEFPLTIWSLVFIAWFAGALVILFRIARNTMRLLRIRLEAQPTTLEELDCHDCSGIFTGIERVNVSFHDLIGSPILVGILRPSILLPADLIQWTTAEERRVMIQHEIAHLARRDHYVNLFLRLLNLVFYFHPLIIFACRQLEIEREMSCDDRVINQGAKAEVYAEGILKAAGRNILSGGLHQLGITSAKQVLERRIGMIMDEDRVRQVINHRRKLVLSTALISVLVLMLSPARSESVGIRQRGVQTQTTDHFGGGQFGGKVLTVTGQPFDDKVVTGQPFTADSVIEINQTLADGSRVITRQTTAVARDGQGRTHSEKIFASASGDGEQQKTVFISDPVKQVRQVFGPDHVVHELPLSAFSLQPYAISISTAHAARQGSQQVQRFSMSPGAAGGAPRVQPPGVRQSQQFSTAGAPPAAEEPSLNQPGELKEEHLGRQMIGGVEADGIRATLTIPVGQVGNESPIVITDERWYSPELQVTVLVKHTDPRFGESSYQLTNIQRTEPLASMFQAPPDYPIERPGKQ